MGEKRYRINIVAVDFDDCINFGVIDDDIDNCTYFFNKKALKVLKDFQARGGIVILWTCRTGEHLKEAIEMLDKLTDFKPDYINEDCKEYKERYAHQHVEPISYPKARKVYADLYIDDRNTVWRDLNWEEINEWFQQTLDEEE